MDANELIQLYEAVRRRRPDLPELEPKTVAVSIATDRVATAALAQSRVMAFEPLEGWIGFQSSNEWFQGRSVPAMGEASGVLLSAEVVDAAGNSLHVRYDGRGEWLVTQYRLGRGIEFSSDVVEHLGPPDVGWLRYRRFWRLSADLGAAPCAACFIGSRRE